jgi:hypothetical protein
MLIGELFGWDWNGRIDAGEAVVGAGTLLLAAVTAWMARRTGQDVKRGRESVEIAQRALELEDKPFLVATPAVPAFEISAAVDRDTGEPAGGPEWRCDVELVNHGRGPAIFDGASLTDEGGREYVGPGWKVEGIYLPGETSRLEGIGLGASKPPKPEGGRLTLRLRYRSASGVRYETSHRMEIASQRRAIRLDFRQTRIEE